MCTLVVSWLAQCVWNTLHGIATVTITTVIFLTYKQARGLPCHVIHIAKCVIFVGEHMYPLLLPYYYVHSLEEGTEVDWQVLSGPCFVLTFVGNSVAEPEAATALGIHLYVYPRDYISHPHFFLPILRNLTTCPSLSAKCQHSPYVNWQQLGQMASISICFNTYTLHHSISFL